MGDDDDVGVVEVLLPALPGRISLAVDGSLLIGVDEYQLEKRNDLERRRECVLVPVKRIIADGADSRQTCIEDALARARVCVCAFAFVCMSMLRTQLGRNENASD